MPKRKHRKSHPGVVIVRPEGRNGWRVRYRAPDTGKLIKRVIPDEDAVNADTRRDYAADLSADLAKRRAGLEAPRKRGESLSATVERYFQNHRGISRGSHKLRRRAADKFLAWAERYNAVEPEDMIKTGDDLRKRHLWTFRAYLTDEPRRMPVRSEEPGWHYQETDEPRAKSSVNVDLASALTVLRYLRKRLDYFPHVASDEICEALAGHPMAGKKKHPLSPERVRAVLRAALDHDSVTYANGRGRYTPAAPFILFVLLTGMRVGEALLLDWAWIHLDALSDHGQPSGEIRIPPEVTKTKGGRTVVLEVSSTLRALLIALEPDPERRVGRVWGVDSDNSAAQRLNRGTWNRDEHGKVVPGSGVQFNWQLLRVTCACYLVNSPGIFGSASIYREAKQLGHSTQEAEESYLRVVRGIPRDAATLEAAIGIESLAWGIVNAAESRSASPAVRLPGRAPRLTASR